MKNDQLLILSILIATAGVLWGIFFDVPRYLPAIIIFLAAIPAIESTKD